jgi:AraC-like DNA-binding protein
LSRIISEIPAYELKSGNEEVSFAIRSTQDILEMFGPHTDKPHRHQYFTVIWSHNASGKHIVDYKEFEMHENDIFFVSPGQVHQVLHNENPDGTVILFTCEFLSKNFISENFISNLNLFDEIASTPPIHVDKQTAEILHEIRTKMKTILSKNDPFKFDLIGAYLKLFLIECNKFAHQPISDNTQTIQSAKIILQNFKELLEKNFIQFKQVNHYAKELNITADYLNNVVKTTIGKTAKELIQQRIIIEAKRLGLHTALSTKEIAFSLGFEDPSHFSRFFKNADGSSFSDFRNSLEIELNR